jgi:hypothetical protein
MQQCFRRQHFAVCTARSETAEHQACKLDAHTDAEQVFLMAMLKCNSIDCSTHRYYRQSSYTICGCRIA